MSKTALPFDDNLFSTLAKLEGFIFDNEESFLKRFICSLESEGVELLGVYFSSECVKVHYLLSCGQHVGDTIKNDKVMEWIKTLN